ncbi:uncharacterized protein FA14DRAFT_155753 [Meira miltonrushii]|uniref:Uncharacterized protein n=1 Tax=Meira miltonrushii TaxID=1280837 RepID=A0A316VH42_9BASI|nr:uncharacterized protein FA14DRAFT_155753 [Meira miltonrushii]PWN36348.1 hypothetical protein FA14DRAFT_155753 [Meira miltonrushii]
MEWSLLSPSSTPTETFSVLCGTKDEQAQFFPSKPQPGMIKHFQPLIDALEKCIGSYPVASAEEVEETLKKDCPNAITDQKLISFSEYVYLACLRGIPIRFDCDQIFGKPKYMWFHFDKEAWLNTYSTDQNIDHEVKNIESNIEDTSDLIIKYDESKDVEPIIEEAKELSIQEKLSRSRIKIILRDTRRQFLGLELDRHYFDYISEYWEKSGHKGREKTQNSDRVRIFYIMISMIKGKNEFCEDYDLLKFTEAILTFAIWNVREIPVFTEERASFLIEEFFPEILGSPSDSKFKRNEKFAGLLYRLSNFNKHNRASQSKFSTPLKIVKRLVYLEHEN